MADNVQWIKLKVGMFDGNSFKKIKRARIGGVSYRDKLTAIWFELLDLAGKSNANGCLIDNNEIAYHTFEDIACMLDREEKEIELCMQFFINEKMVEIVDDVYCLTNFMMYQNQDGLEKIREQRRIAQSKWRERKKLGLIGQNVDEKISTVESTHHLPSISISNSNSISISNEDNNRVIGEEKETYTEQYKEICEYLNLRANTNYRPTSKEFQKHVKARLNEGYTVDDFKKVIDIKVDKWLDDPKWCDYLRPQTLFGTKFEAYLNEKPKYKKETKDFMEECNIKTDRTGGLF